MPKLKTGDYVLDELYGFGKIIKINIVWRNLISPDDLKEKGFPASGYIIKYKKKPIFQPFFQFFIF